MATTRAAAFSLVALFAACLAGCPLNGIATGPSSSVASSVTSGSSTGGGSSGGSSAGGGSTGGSSSSGGSTSSASSSALSSSGTTSSSGSTSIGGGSSGAGCDAGAFVTGETFCPEAAICPLAKSCAAGAPLGSQLVDFYDCTAIANGSITALDALGGPLAGLAAQTGDNGGFAVCVPEGAPFTLQTRAPAYLTTYFAEMLNLPESYLSQMPTLSAAEFNAIAQALPQIDTADANLLVHVVGSTCHDRVDGWSFGLALPDGGAVPDGGYQLIYFGGSYVPDLGATATTSTGSALFFDLDPSFQGFLVVTASNPDAGSCVPETGVTGFTGRVYVSGSALSLGLVLLP